MTQVKDIAALIESFAPLAYQESYDNSGLIVGHEETEVKGVLLAVDVTEEVIEEAKQLGVNMIITHHPIVFHPLKRFNSSNYVERCVEEAIRSNIVLYACHTNLDSTPNGMSWRLAQKLSLRSVELLEPSRATGDVGFGVVGEIDEAVDFEEYIKRVASKLSLKSVRYSAPHNRKIRRVAICTGSGSSLISEVRRSGVDLYITADLKYNDFMEPASDFIIADIGHFESEYCAIDIFNDILSKKMFNFAVRKSESSCNPVHYRAF